MMRQGWQWPDRNDPGHFSSQGMCILSPPLGSFQSHRSACDPRRGVIPSFWHCNWVQEGTRRFKYNHRERKLLCVAKKGHGKVLMANLGIRDLDDNTHWWTYEESQEAGVRARRRTKMCHVM